MEERCRRTSEGFGVPDDPDTLNAVGLTGKGWDHFENNTRGPHEQDPRNREHPKYMRVLLRNELQDRIIVVKGLDANCTPGEILELFRRGGIVTAIAIIRGVYENYWGPRLNKWTGGNLTYVEYSQARMLDGPVQGVSSCGALDLRERRYLNRVYEVYRSNLNSKGTWDEEED